MNRAALLVALGCGGHTDPTPPAPTPSRTAPPLTQAEWQAKFDASDPCQLFTSAEVNAAFGLDVGDGFRSSNGKLRACTWTDRRVTDPMAQHALDVSVTIEDHASVVASSLATDRKLAPQSMVSHLEETPTKIGMDSFFEVSTHDVVLHIGTDVLEYALRYGSAGGDPKLEAAAAQLFTLAASKIR